MSSSDLALPRQHGVLDSALWSKTSIAQLGQSIGLVLSPPHGERNMFI
ncbi:uncharacterized protein METZ01_LOCUS516522 [marine metagenome]|uniref:Uncharacterized protein n=1 Tax=marine metagenome TaxID=408172 RepID=A0A383F5L9_9ZZZZ